MTRIPPAALAVLLVLLPACRSTHGDPAHAPRSVASPAGSDETVLATDGVAIHYHVEGSGSPALVLLHGWACDGSIWDAQVRALSPRFTVATIDLPGHGRSGKDRSSWSVRVYAEDVREVVRRLSPHDVILVGHSMSGYVILETAALLPDRVIGLIPVDTLQDAEWKPGPAMNTILESMQKDFKTATREFAASMFSERADPALVERMQMTMSSMDSGIGLPVLRAVFSYDAAAALDRVKQPIHAIESDRYPVRLETNRRHAPQFKSVVIAGTGHFPMLEKPEEFNRLLIEAVEDVTRSGRSSGR